jgi:hypothetical protein
MHQKNKNTASYSTDRSNFYLLHSGILCYSWSWRFGIIMTLGPMLFWLCHEARHLEATCLSHPKCSNSLALYSVRHLSYLLFTTKRSWLSHSQSESDGHSTSKRVRWGGPEQLALLNTAATSCPHFHIALSIPWYSRTFSALPRVSLLICAVTVMFHNVPLVTHSYNRNFTLLLTPNLPICLSVYVTVMVLLLNCPV